MSGPAQATLEQSRTGKLSRVTPGQSKPPDLKRSEPLQARLEQTRTRKLRSGQASPNHLTSNDLSPLEEAKMAKTMLHARVGAKASILSRFIRQAATALSTQFEDNGKQFFQFRNSGNGASDQLLSGLCCWDMKDGIVPLEPGGLMLKELYVMRPEYAECAYKEFSSRFLSLWKSIKKNLSRAEEDKAAFDLYAVLNGKALNPSDCYETT
eukprot:jgi/Psemu1/20145/gm1.20145_g